MTRVLRYPRLCALSCAGAMAVAVARDLCVGSRLFGWARVLLVITLLLLFVSFGLLSCRFLVSAGGVGVGFLFRVRRTPWDELAAFGSLCCNSRRMYLYGLYKNSPDFLHMLHRAPRCGSWGFVVPMSRKLAAAVSAHCPYALDLYTGVRRRREKGMRPVWHHTALQLLFSLGAAAVAAPTAAALLLRASEQAAVFASVLLTLLASLLLCFVLSLLWRAFVCLQTCPFISENGVSAGRGLYLSWDEVRFGYVHRMAQVSGLFLLSEPLDAIADKSGAPVRCLSMPDASTLVLAYLTYCPHAGKAMEA